MKTYFRYMNKITQARESSYTIIYLYINGNALLYILQTWKFTHGGQVMLIT